MWAKKDIFEDAKAQKPSKEYKNSIVPWANIKIYIGLFFITLIVGFVIYAVFFFEG